jgi:threonine/homoserine/homoserine lactone efflux protein
LGGFILATIHNVLTFTWFSLIILGAGFAQSALRNPRVQKLWNAFQG